MSNVWPHMCMLWLSGDILPHYSPYKCMCLYQIFAKGHAKLIPDVSWCCCINSMAQCFRTYGGALVTNIFPEKYSITRNRVIRHKCCGMTDVLFLPHISDCLIWQIGWFDILIWLLQVFIFTSYNSRLWLNNSLQTFWSEQTLRIKKNRHWEISP